MLEITWGVSWWDYTSQTFPTTTASVGLAFNPGAVCSGNLNMAAVGTTTSSPRSYRNLTLTHTLGVVPLEGPGGANPYQKVIGAMRTPDTIEIEWTEESEAATATPSLPLLALGTFQHIEFTGSTADGSAFGFAMPRACVVNRPLQMADAELNRLKIKLRAHTSSVTTNALTLSAIVYGEA